ncbi:hypothetical protein ATDW_21150 [Asticcacaulis sp. DW145]|uniref:glycosyltransferase n=1 Tax=Asticcacaulis sp. DW145 TaxID=3095608 RepID=UPI00308538C4|nr:hypothetical protein ATDW_21150 [Asticcacaulis sp. DW145]
MNSEFPTGYIVNPNNKIAFVFAKSWKQYYSCSPFYWFMFSNHKYVDVYEFEGSDFVGEITQIIIQRGYIGVVFCEVCAPAFRKFDFPKMIVTDDLHRFFRNYSREYYSEVHASTPVLSDYCLAKPISALPLSVNEVARSQMIYCPNYTAHYPWHKPHSERKALGIAGTLSEAAYPLRTRMIKALADLDPRPERSELREKFIEVLGEYRIGLTDDVAYGSIVAKYFEIPMAGSLLIAPEPHSEIEKLILGFSDDNSALIPRARIYDDVYVEKIVRDAVGDLEGTEARAIRGQQLSMRRHTVEARVRYIWSIFQRINAGTWSIRDQFDLFLASESRLEDETLSGDMAPTTFGGRILLQTSEDASVRAILSALGGGVEKLTIVAPTVTEGERLLSQICEQRNDFEVEVVLFDRTRVERLAQENDVILLVDGAKVTRPEKITGIGGWVHEPSADHIRQSALAFWRIVRDGLRARFGSAIIHHTEEESFDWDFGAIDFWLWLSRERSVRVRVERVLRADPYIGILAADGASDEAVTKIKDVFMAELLNANSTDHWQVFTQLTQYPVFHDVKRVDWDEKQARYTKAIGDALRILIDDVTANESMASRM